MAILRILGSHRNLLFQIVITEVVVIGVIGVTFGVGLGQLITTYAVVPLIENQMMQQGFTPTLTPTLSIGAISPAVIGAFAVLIISSIKPAQDAAQDKGYACYQPWRSRQYSA